MANTTKKAGTTQPPSPPVVAATSQRPARKTPPVPLTAKVVKTSPRKPVRPKGGATTPVSMTASVSPSTSPSSNSKQSQVIALLRQPRGASLSELMTATGWHAHSVRGVISGTLKKRLGLAVQTDIAADGVRRYRIASAA